MLFPLLALAFSIAWGTLAHAAGLRDAAYQGLLLACMCLCGWIMPEVWRRRYLAEQNRLMDRCRALFIVGSRAYASRQTATAEAMLARIREYEHRWRLGSSLWFRLAHAVAGIAVATVMFVAIEGLVWWWLRDPIYQMSITPARANQTLEFAAFLFVWLGVHAIPGYAAALFDPQKIDNCGDRLWQLIHGPKAMAMPASRRRRDPAPFAGLTARQILGLGPRFTRKQLDAARRTMAKDLHPDRWHTATPGERSAREDALKAVNAAYDELLRSARSRPWTK